MRTEDELDWAFERIYNDKMIDDIYKMGILMGISYAQGNMEFIDMIASLMEIKKILE